MRFEARMLHIVCYERGQRHTTHLGRFCAISSRRVRAAYGRVQQVRRTHPAIGIVEPRQPRSLGRESKAQSRRVDRHAPALRDCFRQASSSYGGSDRGCVFVRRLGAARGCPSAAADAAGPSGRTAPFPVQPG